MMKKMKLALMAVVALVMSTTLTSCLGDSNSDYTPTYSTLVAINNVYGTYTFTATDGVTLIPTETSLAAIKQANASFDMSKFKSAFINYTLAEEVKEGATSYKVDLTGISITDGTYVETSKGAMNDSLSVVTTPESLIDVDGWTLYDESGKSYTQNMTFCQNAYKQDYIWLLNNYYTSGKFHYLTLVSYPEEDTADGVTFYLVNNGRKDYNTSYNSKTVGGSYPSYYYSAFFVGNRLQDWCDEYGKTECKVKVVFKKNSYNYDYEKGDETTYTATYKMK